MQNLDLFFQSWWDYGGSRWTLSSSRQSGHPYFTRKSLSGPENVDWKSQQSWETSDMCHSGITIYRLSLLYIVHNIFCGDQWVIFGLWNSSLFDQIFFYNPVDKFRRNAIWGCWIIGLSPNQLTIWKIIMRYHFSFLYILISWHT